ncbi:hypothetical protein FLK61_26580 [Paenalkalicoccus suaedae]|uniref:DUF4367 domain-containing protein n=2 Tax=Paenalkalicoccus suaedae TaxID=2592382 RepID=A0A859FDI9_9BACI|nr:hypothetical protein FLK61_26580 [Paenalkalicoccus suaedae]
MKKLLVIILSLACLLLAACGDSGLEFTTGEYVNDFSIDFSEEAINDKEQIQQALDIFAEQEETDTQATGQPDHVVTINDLDNSTALVFANIWTTDDQTLIYNSAGAEDTFYLITGENADVLLGMIEELQ